jgi:hypothetical protein
VPRFNWLRFSAVMAPVITMLGRTLVGDVGFVVTREMPVTPVALPEAVMRFCSMRALTYDVGTPGWGT